MQLRVSATALAILLSAPLTFAGTLAPGGGSPTGVLDANSNVGTTLATTLAGERNASSATDSYLAVRQEANATIVVGTTAVAIGGGVAGDTHLIAIHIHTALAGTCVIDGFTDQSGSADTYILPIGTVGHIPMYAAINAAGASVVTCSNAADNKKVLVLWRPR